MDESIYFYKTLYYINGDANNKPATAVQSQSVARSQCWKAVLIGTGSLSAPDVNSTENNQLQPRKNPAVGSQPGPILTF